MSVQIVQLSDPHLFAGGTEQLKGVPTRAALEEVLRWIDVGEAEGRWRFDQWVWTGDLTHDERRGTYEWLRDRLSDRLERCLFLPGNHDDRGLLREVLCASQAGQDNGSTLSTDTGEPDTGEPGVPPFVTFSRQVGRWRLLGLDSHLPGQVEGAVAPEQLEWLRRQLEASAGPVLVFVHHPPLDVGSSWIDGLRMRDGERLLRILADSGKVRGLACGHVHQVFEREVDGLRVLTAPSTAVQFRPGTERLELDPLPAGVRIFHLNEETFETEVARLDRLTYPPREDA